MASHDTDRLAELLLTVNRLKTTPRTGWAVRGVPAPESVADHSHGVTIAALALLEVVDAEPAPDRARVLEMAALHDLPESVTGDLSLGASRLLPPGVKAASEAAAMDELLGGLPFAAAWREAWDEFEAQETPSARLVRDADRVDLLLQTLVYERTTGNRMLDEFWRFAPEGGFHYAASRALVRRLLELRP